MAKGMLLGKMSMPDYEREQEGIKRITRLFSAQEKEIHDKMVKFDGFLEDPYSIKIIDDSYGWLTCNIRLRKSGTLCYTVRFQKKIKQGVVWNFMDASRLNRLYIHEDLFPDLIVKD